VIEDKGCNISPHTERCGMSKREHSAIPKKKVEAHCKKGKDKDFRSKMHVNLRKEDG